mmetsp:Transcript_44882/g.105820  ORF Transcript_44882/g.105820 Transcript_44882/m.105820 type:complete len:181 (+) Transcript_44882:542-1084(+)
MFASTSEKEVVWDCLGFDSASTPPHSCRACTVSLTGSVGKTRSVVRALGGKRGGVGCGPSADSEGCVDAEPLTRGGGERSWLDSEHAPVFAAKVSSAVVGPESPWVASALVSVTRVGFGSTSPRVGYAVVVGGVFASTGGSISATLPLSASRTCIFSPASTSVPSVFVSAPSCLAVVLPP